MPAPFQHVHGQDGRIGHLHEEDLVAGNVGDGARVALERQRVETVEQHTQGRVIGLPDDVPDLLIGIHVAAPRQGFIADAQATLAGAFAQLAQIVDEDLLLAQRVGGGVAAHQHQVGAQFLHQVELVLGAVEVARHARAIAAFEVTERLEQGDGDTQVGAHLAHFTRTAVVVQQIILEDFHAIEAGGGNGFEFFRQGTAQGYGGDRTLHGTLQ